jgi:exoribonuclease R
MSELVPSPPKRTGPIPASGKPSAGPVRTGAAGRDFSALRAEFALPGEFPAEALAEAEQAIGQPPQDAGRADATALPLVTVDPPGAKDLDQAVLVERGAGGAFRVYYAVADLSVFVRHGGALDAEVRRRGQTLYLPDGKIPLHPAVLSEGAASLLPEQVRPAALWTIDCTADGDPQTADVRRAWVRSVAQFDYETVQSAIEAGVPHPSLAALPEFGRLRRQRAVQRGAIEPQLPEQRIEPDGQGHWRLTLRPRADVEVWNAEISLLTGMCAARMMLAAGVGVLRTLPTPVETAVVGMRRSAAALGIEWPAGASPAEVLAHIDPRRPDSLALHVDAIQLLRGASYTAFDGAPPPLADHAGIGAAYTHVTAPLRRLVDRFATEACLAVSVGREVPDWVRDSLPELPSLMGASDALASKVERAFLDQVESWVLADRVGEAFAAVVLRADASGAEVFVADPPVLARCVGEALSEGELIRVRLTEVDPRRRLVLFEPA